jgi:hypothetical protein
MRSRSTILSSAHPTTKAGSFKASEAGRKLATEQYRDVLRQNVMLYGKSRPGERYVREAAARDAYQRHLEAEQVAKNAPPEVEKPPSPADHRASMYSVSHPSPSYRAKDEYMENRAAVKAEDERLDKEEDAYPAKDSPTDEEEARQDRRLRRCETHFTPATWAHDFRNRPQTWNPASYRETRKGFRTSW